jgi:hypothetical protein
MPRKFSRISLLVKQVKCERLQDITEESAVSEGITFRMSGTRILWRDYNASSETCVISMNPVDSYRTLWDSINKDHPWESNPWVWVYRFERIANERKEL